MRAQGEGRHSSCHRAAFCVTGSADARRTRPYPLPCMRVDKDSKPPCGVEGPEPRCSCSAYASGVLAMHPVQIMSAGGGRGSIGD